MGLVNVHISNKVVASAAKGGAQRSRPPRPRVTRPNEQATFVYLAKGWWPKDDGEELTGHWLLGIELGAPSLSCELLAMLDKGLQFGLREL